jgi:hypothetical protein
MPSVVKMSVAWVSVMEPTYLTVIVEQVGVVDAEGVVAAGAKIKKHFFSLPLTAVK